MNILTVLIMVSVALGSIMVLYALYTGNRMSAIEKQLDDVTRRVNELALRVK